MTNENINSDKDANFRLNEWKQWDKTAERRCPGPTRGTAQRNQPSKEGLGHPEQSKIQGRKYAKEPAPLGTKSNQANANAVNE